MRRTAFFLLYALFLPSMVSAEGFYAREAKAERLSWMPFLPHEVVEAAFPEEAGEDAEASADYKIAINLPARRLYLYERSRLLKTYPVAVGTNRYRTPVGPRFLSNVTWNPWWYPPPSDWAKNEKPTPPGPGNPLGRVKMSLGGDIFLHATNKEYTVGSAASHGCMRMRNKDAVELAWFFQTKFSDQTEETLRPKYEARRWESFFVPLKQKIPVDVIYRRVWVNADEVDIHPDVYGRGNDLKQEMVAELSEIGIPPWDVDVSKVDELMRIPNSFTVAIADLLATENLSSF